jgi:hypothetical protein
LDQATIDIPRFFGIMREKILTVSLGGFYVKQNPDDLYLLLSDDFCSNDMGVMEGCQRQYPNVVTAEHTWLWNTNPIIAGSSGNNMRVRVSSLDWPRLAAELLQLPCCMQQSIKSYAGEQNNIEVG